MSDTGLSPATAVLSRTFSYQYFFNSLAVLQPRQMPRDIAGLGSYAFARHYLRNHFCFLFLRVMRCFSSPGLPRTRYGAAYAAGCPIRISTDHGVFASPRGFSQLVTSFIASKSLGILHVPFSPFLMFSPFQLWFYFGSNFPRAFALRNCSFQ